MTDKKGMNKLLLSAISIILLTYAVCFACIKGTADRINTRKNISVLHLVTNPEKYNNKDISTVGRLAKDGRNFYLFTSQESKRKFNIKEAIVLKNKTYVSTESENIRINGIFKALESSKTSMSFNSTLEAKDIKPHIKSQEN